MAAVVHFEIPTDDLERARTFYSSVFAWEITTFPMGGGVDYTGATTTPVDRDQNPTEPGAINGALVDRSEDTPTTVVTVDVASIADTLAQVEAAGGSTVHPRTQIPGMGAYAYVKDTEGNVVGLWETVR